MESLQIENELSELETRMDRVRALYDQYFMGIERLEPLVPRKDVERRIHVLRKEQIRNTGLRFKFQTLVQRFNSMQQVWGRTVREIESGTYRRDVIRAAKRFGSQEALTIAGRKKAERLALMEQAKVEQAERALGRSAGPARSDARPGTRPADGGIEELDLDDVQEDDDDDAPTLPPTQSPVARPAAALGAAGFGRPTAGPPVAGRQGVSASAPSPSRSEELSEARMRQIYNQYVETKRAANESTAGITYAKLSESLRAQAQKLRQSHAKSVDYEVAMKDGKTILKPILR